MDRIWSLQYMVPGPLCGCAGQLDPSLTIESVEKHNTRFTHAVRFRYKDNNSTQRFLKSTQTADLMSGDAGLHDAVTVVFHATVPNDLESLFQRGSDWEEGVELILGLQLKDKEHDDAVEFLDLTRELALSSAYGAVQAERGRVDGIINHVGNAKIDADFVLLIRFLSETASNQFAASPPIAAILNANERAPVSLAWFCALVVAPLESSRSSSQGPGGLI